VHSVGGEVMSFRHLSRLLGREQRFYGIQVPPELRNGEFASSITSMARYYVAALTAFQPEGPYLLGGWSAGSTIALEMAQQLQASGRTVDLLVALDGAPFNTGAGTSPWNPRYHWKLICNFPHWVNDDLLQDFSLRTAARRVRSKLIAVARSARVAAQGESISGSLDVNSFMDTASFSDKQIEFMNSLYRSLRLYVPALYDGEVRVYKSKTEPLYHLFEIESVWSKIAPNVRVVPVRGTHITIVREPHVNEVADDMRRVLSRFRQASYFCTPNAGNYAPTRA
jgi:thioesterase domain-containing protein